MSTVRQCLGAHRAPPRRRSTRTSTCWDLRRDPQNWIDASTLAIDRDFEAADLASVLDATRRRRRRGRSVHELPHRDAGPARDRPPRRRVVGVVGWVDLHAPTCPGSSARCSPHGRRQARRHPPPRPSRAGPGWLLRDDVARGARGARRGRPRRSTSSSASWQLAVAAEVAARHPDLRLVLDHLGNPALASATRPVARCDSPSSRRAETSSRQDLRPEHRRRLECLDPRRPAAPVDDRARAPSARAA